MPRHTSTAVGIIAGLGVWCAPAAAAQLPVPERVLALAPAEAGRVQGIVRDAGGGGVADANVMAVGQTIVSARSDAQGRFSLALPPGDYILKASRAGFVSNYREPVRVLSRARLERTITLVRQADAAADPLADNGHAHTELAWYLRHLTRSVLRDGSLPASRGSDPAGAGRVTTTGPEPQGAFASPLAAALAATDFRGQVNFVTTTTARPRSEWSQGPWPRGVAHVSFGAPVAGRGAWYVRAAMASGSGTSWNVLGEYASEPAGDHAWRLRLSYSAQGYTTRTEQLSAAVAEARTVAGVAGEDRWRISPRVVVEYGARADRFDYLADPYLFSAHGGLTARVLPRTFIRAGAARTLVAPGVDEFLPPADGGPWLPAEQMFFPLSGRGALRAEDVRHAEIALAHQFGVTSGELPPPTVHLRKFWERSTNQMAMLFTENGRTNRGQYAVATVGSVDLAGWGIGLSGQVTRYLRGQVEYTRVTADWQAARRVRAIRAAAPSALREDTERMQDLTATVHADLPRTSTVVSFAYRASNAFADSHGAGIPLPGSRFDLQVRQALPYRPLRSSHVELLFAVRNLFRDTRAEASWYDELLTVGPPVRLMGGVQVRF